MTTERDQLVEANEADVLEQALPVEEHDVVQPAGIWDEASEADAIEGSIEVPLDDEEEPR